MWGHLDEIGCLQFTEQSIVTGSEDCTVRIWDFNTGIETGVLNGHVGGITFLYFNETHVVSASADLSMKLW